MSVMAWILSIEVSMRNLMESSVWLTNDKCWIVLVVSRICPLRTYLRVTIIVQSQRVGSGQTQQVCVHVVCNDGNVMPFATFCRWHLVVWWTIRDKQCTFTSPLCIRCGLIVDCVTIRNEAFYRVPILLYVMSSDWSEWLTFACRKVHLCCAEDTVCTYVCDSWCIQSHLRSHNYLFTLLLGRLGTSSCNILVRASLPYDIHYAVIYITL